MSKIYSLTIYLIIFTLFTLTSNSTYAATLKGHVIDSDTHKSIPGAIVSIVGTKNFFVTGDNGYFEFKNLNKGTYTLNAKMLGYIFSITEKIELKSKGSEMTYDIYKRPNSNTLNNADVNSNLNLETEIISRRDEKLASNIVNIISAKSIELLPDLNVANVMQRVSGISMLKNTFGNNTEVITRGMPPRYNNTLTNGISAASTSGLIRSVPLYMIPANIVGRLEVIKTLTPDMDGNGLGGTVNIEMNRVPEKTQLSFNLSTGYNQYFENYPLYTTNTSGVNMKDPAELNLNQFPNYTYVPNVSEFTRENLVLKTQKALPKNLNGNFSVGRRFMNNKLGLLVSATVVNNSEGSIINYLNTKPNNRNSLEITSSNRKNYVTQSTNIGSNIKLDYEINKFNKISLYNSLLKLTENKVRIQSDTVVESNERINLQNASNKEISTLNSTNIEGVHQILKNLVFDWSLLYSMAGYISPDLVIENFVQNIQPTIQPIYLRDSACVSRFWQHNSNNVRSGYFNFKYKTIIYEHFIDLKFGGMASTKSHTNYANEYTFNAPINNLANSDMNTVELIQNTNESNEIGNQGNFKATENIGAAYVQLKTGFAKLQILTGARMEFTNQSNQYNETKNSASDITMNRYSYIDLLPSLHLNYLINENQNMRFSVYQGISRPNYTELVDFYIPGVNGGVQGNKNLKHSTGTSFDTRYEIYPNKEDLFTAGIFYKHIKRPIEDLIENNNVITPTNGPNCANYGFEIVGIKYLGNFGLNINYTYTKSVIKTSKIYYLPTDSITPTFISETRPLVSQSPHIVNVAFIYRDAFNGVKFQLVYTMLGENLKNTSANYGLDVYQKKFQDLGATFETRTFSNKLFLYLKASNLLNSTLKYYTKSGIKVMDISTSASYLIGLRLKL